MAVTVAPNKKRSAGVTPRRPSVAMTDDETGATNNNSINNNKQVTADSAGEEVKTVERYSSRMSMSISDRQTLDQMIRDAENEDKMHSERPETGTSLSSAMTRQDIVAAARDAKAQALAAMDSNSSTAFGEITITQMEYLGLEVKSGYLMKQSSILGM